MNFEFDQILKDAFGTEAAKVDSAAPGTPYTFANTLEWAVGVQPKKEPSQVSQGTPMAKQFPQEASPEAPLEEPLLSPLDLIGPGVVKGVANVAKTTGKELNKFALQRADIMGVADTSKVFKFSNIVPDINPKIEKYSFSPTWDKEAAAGFLREEHKISNDELWKRYKTYRGSDGIIRQYDYDGFNTIDLNKLDFERRNNVAFKGKLVDIYASPTLYKSHPDLEKTKVKIEFTPYIDAAKSNGVGAAYQQNNNLIKVQIADNFFDYREMKDLKKELLDSLPHEATHVSQRIHNIKTKPSFFSFKKDGTVVNEGSSVDWEPISVKEYANLKKERDSLIQSNSLTEKEANEQTIKKLKEIQLKQYISSYGEVGSFTSEKLRRLTPQEFKNKSPLSYEQEYLSKNKITSEDLIYKNIEERIKKEWGSIDNYSVALQDLYGIPKANRIGIEKVPKNYKAYETTIESSDPYGIPTLIPISFRAKSKEDFIKKVESRLGITFSDAQEVTVAGQARKTRKTPRKDSGGFEFTPDQSPTYIPRYGKRGQEIP